MVKLETDARASSGEGDQMSLADILALVAITSAGYFAAEDRPVLAVAVWLGGVTQVDEPPTWAVGSWLKGASPLPGVVLSVTTKFLLKRLGLQPWAFRVCGLRFIRWPYRMSK